MKAASGRKVAITSALEDDSPDAGGRDERITTSIPVDEPIPDHVFIAFGHVSNDNIIFGIPAPFWLEVSVPGILVIGVLAAYVWRGPFRGQAANLGVGLFVGGTLGNWIDRLRFGWVTDFVDVRIVRDVKWFTFNLADVFILVAIIICAVAILKMWPAKAEKAPWPARPPAASPGPRMGLATAWTSSARAPPRASGARWSRSS